MKTEKGFPIVRLLAFAFAAVVSVNAWATNTGGGSSSVNKMIIGDSIFALSGDIHRYLQNDLNETINTYARSGCQMNGGNIICSSYYSVPRQYSRASKRGIKTVIMNGGGNDFLLGDGAGCGAVENCLEVLFAVEETISGLVDDMHSDGIQKIIFLGYYSTTASSGNNALNDYSMNYKAANYPSMGVRFVETRPAFRGNESRYITSDGIHPTAAGSRVLATLIRQALN